MVLLKIAYRNLKEHKTKTLIIGSIIALGLIILVVGNSLLETAEEGIRRTYTENFTGQVIVTAAANQNLSLFMGPGSMNNEPTPIVPGHAQLVSYLDTLPGIENTVSQITGFATADLNGEGNAFLQLFGIDPQAYLEMFPRTIEVIEGRFLEADETGLVVSKDVAQMLEESSGRALEIGDTVLLTNMNSVSGTKIREIEIKGIIRFVSEAANLDLISYIDVNSLRALSGMTKVIDVELDLSQVEQEALGSVDEEDLFGGADELFAETELDSQASNEESLLSILGDTSEAQALRELNPDAWQYVLLEVEDNVPPQRLIRSLNSAFEELELNAKAYGWVEAAGATAQLVSGLKTVFNALIFVVAVVSIIIIMNTLVISITERIGEIGTMRAVGARRSFVRRMITLETLMISLVFGLTGIALGGGIIGILNLTGIEASSMFLQVLFGGSVLTPVVSMDSVLASLFMVIVVGIAASLYPVSIALKIEPVRAMNQR